MFKVVIADYINKNLIAHKKSAKEAALKCDIPESTLSNYRTGKIENPNLEHLYRIAAFFGDDPEVIRRLRQQAEESAAEEARLKADAKDRQLIDQITGIIREGSIEMLKQYSELTAAQQTEIIQHADRQIEEERRRAADLNAKVLRQCNEEVARVKEVCAREIAMTKEFCDQRVRMTEQHYEARLEDAREHLAQMMASEGRHSGELRERYGSSREYLKSSVRNLSASCILLALTSIFFGAYAIFAYTTFDMKDPTRGLHTENYSMGPVVLALTIILVAIAGSRLFILFLNRPKKKEKVEG